MIRFLLLTLVFSLAANAGRIAVIGDSISTGAHAESRALDGFPGRLGHLFEGRHEVRAFATSGNCLLRKSARPIDQTAEFKAALDWNPDIALVMLGTDDTSNQVPNWKHHADLESDARFLVESLRKANPRVIIHLLGPPPMFPEKPGLTPERKSDLEIRAPRLQAIRDTYRRIAATEARVFHHDLTRALTAELTSDGVEPDTFGHEAIADHLCDLLAIPIDEAHDLSKDLQKAGIKTTSSDFHGYRALHFELPGDGSACTIVCPTQSVAGRPWIWRARFFGHQPALDLSLLDRGHHVAWCDVADLYGSTIALDRWDAFHRLLTQTTGLAPKPVLEGMSRGGLPVFLWASRNPGKVAAIYGDNPVCDFRSWPGGNPGPGSPRDWKKLLAAHSISATQAVSHPQPCDPDVLRPIAAAKIPVALVLGTADNVVPPAANGERLAANYTKLGGPVRIWHKPGAGHHPHGLHPPDPLRRFLTRTTPPPNIAKPSSK